MESEKISSPLSWEVSSLDSSEDRLDESPSDESLMNVKVFSKMIFLLNFLIKKSSVFNLGGKTLLKGYYVYKQY